MSYNSLFGLGSHSPDANLEGWWPLMDNAANTTVADYSGNGLSGTAARNTSLTSTTGPNAWLSSAWQGNGSSDVINLGNPASIQAIAAAITVLCRAKPAATGRQDFIAQWSAGQQHFNMLQGVAASRFSFFVSTGGGGTGAYSSTNFSTGSWYHLAGKYDRTTLTLRENKSQVGSGPLTFAMLSTSTENVLFGDSPDSGNYSGALASVAIFSRALTDAECDEDADGPEPVNSAAPSLSGTQTEGQALTCSSGTWGLDSPFSGGSNGTITYSYQWTRSNDGSGGGEANISGATASAYTLQAGDVGKYIRCWVRASNDGGYDVAADTASGFTGSIAGAGGGANRLLNLRRRAAAA